MRKNIFLLLTVMATVFLSGCNGTDGPVVWVKADDFAKLVKKYPGALIIDLRSRDDFDLDHWPGAVPLHYEHEEFEGFLRQLSPRQVYLMYDYDGKQSKQVASIMEGLYFQKVYAVRGGWERIQIWQEKELRPS